MKHILAAAALLALAGTAHANTPGPASAPAGAGGPNAIAPATPSSFYGVVFGLVVDEHQQLSTFRVMQVLDPRLGPETPVNVPVPDSFIAAARKLAEAKHYEARMKDGKPVEFYTYFIFFPSRPDRADLDPKTYRP